MAAITISGTVRLIAAKQDMDNTRDKGNENNGHKKVTTIT
jgi:hypothetical protein